ncbi:MAG: hypothetical protein KAX05_09885 [Bacteroidales bacterium]|nr:hypothetical protein [Bacteroidales bacterium]
MRLFHSGWILIILLFCMLSTACQTTSIIKIQILESSEVSLPRDIHEITIINRSLKTNLVTQNQDSGKHLPSNDAPQHQELTHNCIQGLSDLLITSPFIDTVFYDSLLYYFGLSNDSMGKPLPLDLQDVEWVCAKTNTELLISLEDYDCSDTISKDIQYSFFHNAEDAILKRNYVAYLNVSPKAFWRIYDLTNKKIIDEYLYIDTIQWERSDNESSKALKQLPEKNNAILEAAYWAGYGYGKRIVPSWLDVDRFYYKSGSKEIKQADKEVLKDNWTGAVQIWKKLAYGEKKSLAAKAALNMALASEIEDQLEIALEWAEKSYLMFKRSSSKEYLLLLQERVKEKRKLLSR